MAGKISFIPAADLHLGLAPKRFTKESADRIRGARIEAMRNILAQAEKHKVGFIVIAGDLFEDNAIDGTIARMAFDILEESSPVPVFIIPGNHDPLTRK